MAAIKRQKCGVCLPDEHVGLFAYPCISPAGVWQAGKQEGGWAGGKTQASSEPDKLGRVKGHNDQMIGTTEEKCVAM